MKRTLAALLCFVFLSIGSLFPQQPAAPAPATQEDVQKLFEVMQSRKLMDGIMEAMKQRLPEMTADMIKKQVPNASMEDMAQIQVFANEQVAKMIATMPVDEMLHAMIPAYRQHFTHDDVQQLTQFYSSPIGKKFLAEMPALMDESSRATEPVLRKWQESMMADMQKSAEEFAKKLQQKAPPAPAKKDDAVKK